MKNIMGIVKLNESEKYLREITSIRNVATIPFGGRYRLIDFILSNMVNSGIQNVGIFASDKSRSLMDHLRSGKYWDLHRINDGLLILPTDFISSFMPGLYKGDLDMLHSHIDYINNSSQEYVLMTNSNAICNIDFSEIYEFHRDMGADITIVCKEGDEKVEDFTKSNLLEIDDNGWVTSIDVCPQKPVFKNISLEMYLLKKPLLMDIISKSISKGGTDFVKDGLIRNMDKLDIAGYVFNGYSARIVCMESYFKHNMDLLNPVVVEELFHANGLIYTKVKNEAPTRYLNGAKVHNSFVAGGCLIKGYVENSILFRGVEVKKNAHITNSIIMTKSEVEEDACLESVILDKSVRITRGRKLYGHKTHPIYVGKNNII